MRMSVRVKVLPQHLTGMQKAIEIYPMLTSLGGMQAPSVEDARQRVWGERNEQAYAESRASHVNRSTGRLMCSECGEYRAGVDCLCSSCSRNAKAAAQDAYENECTCGETIPPLAQVCPACGRTA